MLSFNVSGILETIGPQYGLNVQCDGIDDVAYGCVITSDAPIIQFYQGEMGLYNYQIIDRIIDGIPIVNLVRRPIGSNLTIDFEITEASCIQRDPSQPVITCTRTDPDSLPRRLELQYTSSDRLYATNVQDAKNPAARVTNGSLSVSTRFIIPDDTARELCFDYLFRLWANQLSVAFEHENPNIEPGDTIDLVRTNGLLLTLLVQQQTLTKERTSQVTGILLQQQTGINIAAGSVITSALSGVGTIKAVATVLGVSG
jgi:putative tail protein